MSDEQQSNEQSEVEGHAKRFFKDPAEQAAQVEGHPFTRLKRDDAEAPSEDEAVADESREPQDAEVEGHPARAERRRGLRHSPFAGSDAALRGRVRVPGRCMASARVR